VSTSKHPRQALPKPPKSCRPHRITTPHNHPPPAHAPQQQRLHGPKYISNTSKMAGHNHGSTSPTPKTPAQSLTNPHSHPPGSRDHKMEQYVSHDLFTITGIRAGIGINKKMIDMMVNRHKYFRWTKRTAWITFAYVVIVPTMLGTAGYMTEVSGGIHDGATGGANGRHRASGRCVESEGEILSRSFRGMRGWGMCIYGWGRADSLASHG
jgi:hypothetical protein